MTDELTKKQQQYQYDYSRLPPIAMVTKLPPAEKQTKSYKRTWNRMAVQMVLGNWIRSVPRLWRLPTLHSFAKVWVKSPPAPVVRLWNLDREFARQRVAGMNPRTIELVTDLAKQVPHRMRPKPEDMKRPLGGEEITLEELVKEKRLFVCNYEHLHGLETKSGRWYAAPIALFAWRTHTANGDREIERLVPVAITTGQDQNSPAYLPNHNEDWLVAKFFVQNADALHSDYWNHLVQYHFICAPFVISTHRQLPSSHPMFKVLLPHFQFALNVNEQFLQLSARSLYRKVMPFTPSGQSDLFRRAYDDWSFIGTGFREELESRGVLDPNVLPDYPYRDDGLLVLDAVETFAREYVEHHWDEDAAVAGDMRLQAWAQELAGTNSDEGHVKDFPATIEDRKTLADVLTRILMIFGPGHASVHSPSADYAIFTPNMTNSLYRAPTMSTTTGEQPATGQVLRTYLPPRRRLRSTFMLHYAITNIRWGQFSGFGEEYDDESMKIAARLTRRLNDIEQELNARNRERMHYFEVDYPYLVPSRILNSIYA